MSPGVSGLSPFHEKGQGGSCPLLDQAFAEISELTRHDKLRYGDIRRISNKYAYGDQRFYSALKKRCLRNLSPFHQMFAGAKGRRLQERPQVGDATAPRTDLHVRPFFWTKLVDPSPLASLPWVAGKGRRGFWQVVTPEMTIQAWRSGRVQVYDKDPGWKECLVRTLREYGWTDPMIGSLIESFKQERHELHIAIESPGVTSQTLPPKVYNDGKRQITVAGDKTPFSKGTFEVMIKEDTGVLESQISLLTKAVQDVRSTLAPVMGGLSYANLINLVNQIGLRQAQIVERLAKLEILIASSNHAEAADPDTGSQIQSPAIGECHPTEQTPGGWQREPGSPSVGSGASIPQEPDPGGGVSPSVAFCPLLDRFKSHDKDFCNSAARPDKSWSKRETGLQEKHTCKDGLYRECLYYVLNEKHEMRENEKDDKLRRADALF